MSLMGWNEQMAAKQEALGTFYCVPGLCFRTHLSCAHNSCSPGLAAVPPRTPTDTLSTSLPSHSVSLPWAQPALVAFPFSSLSWLPISPTVCTCTGGRGCFCSPSLCRRCSVVLFKHCEGHTSTTSSFNAASAHREIKALSCLTGWIKKDLAPTAILPSPLPPCFCSLTEKLLHLKRFGGKQRLLFLLSCPPISSWHA